MSEIHSRRPPTFHKITVINMGVILDTILVWAKDIYAFQVITLVHRVLTTSPLLWVYYSWRNRYLDLRYFAGRSGYKIFYMATFVNVSINLQDSVSQMTGEDRGTFQPVPFLGLPIPFVEKYNVAVRAQGQQSPLK